MTAPFDETDFVDRDLQLGQKAAPAAGAALAPVGSVIAARPPTREELEAKVNETQDRINELRRRQEELERERIALEEARRRRQEFETGRAEMQQHLIRGVGLLEKAEFTARQEAEQMARTLAGFRTALDQVQAIHEETWTQERWQTELARALTTVENARMEWNAARLKWPLLNGEATAAAGPAGDPARAPRDWLAQPSFWQWCKLGLALTWPLIATILVAAGVLVAVRALG
jgi:hypothetical protein